MKKVTQILLRAYLRRYPARFRLSQFNFLSKYSWIKNVLEDLRPEFFPLLDDEGADVAEGVPFETVPRDIIHPLEGREIRGDRGTYRIDTFQYTRGNGLIFSGVQVESNQPVTIKVYRLEHTLFSEADIRDRQQAFESLAGLKLADERDHDFRVRCPIEAIADVSPISADDGRHAAHCCYLMTDGHDAESFTLAEAIAQRHSFPPATVRRALEQILQTLAFLHQQRYSFPSGQMQTGVIHGNLSLDSLLLVTHGNREFVYLTDLLLWERCFIPPAQLRPNHSLPESVVTPASVAEDLKQVGLIALSLLNGRSITEVPTTPTDSRYPGVDRELEQVIRRLFQQGAGFKDAEIAWREVVELNRTQPIIASSAEVSAEPPASQEGRSPWLWSLLGIMVLAGLGGLLWTLWMRPRLSVAGVAQAPVSCCLRDISAVPTGTFTYTAVDGGIWDYIQGQTNLLKRQQTLELALKAGQPAVTLNYAPSESVERAIAQVESGEADFAVLPLAPPFSVERNVELDSQVVAYDGVVILVSFSYSERDQGLPSALGGHLSLEDVRSLYSGQVTRWDALGGPDLLVRLYATENPEAQAVFEQAIFGGDRLDTLPRTDIQFSDDTLEMLRAIIQDFEFERPVGSIGFASLSEVIGQCSVYPLALQDDSPSAVQPLVLESNPINPNTDLCRRKGAYHPDIQSFETGAYPLSYPIGVVYPRDNSRSSIGRKFAEMMMTQEGQRLLAEAGLVPISPTPFYRIQ